MRNVLLTLSVFFLMQSMCLAITTEAFPKGDTFNSPRHIKLSCDTPDAKILWTFNPNGSPDESFVYESPIPIYYSQELWFFAFSDEQNITKFQKENYIIRTDPRRYSRDIHITSFSPTEDWIEIENTGDQRVSFKNWKIEARNATMSLFDSVRFIEAHSKIRVSLTLGDVMDSLVLRSPDRFPKDVFRYILSDKNTETVFTRTGDERFIQW